MIDIWIMGGGGHARVAIDAVRSAHQYSIAGILTDDWSSAPGGLYGVPASGPISLESVHNLEVTNAFIAIGDNANRQRIANELDLHVRWISIIHAKSYVAPIEDISPGTLICAGAIVQPDATIGRHAILNTACSVDHDCVLEDFTQIGPGAHLGGNVTVRTGGFVGIGAAILPGIEIGEWAVVGAGAVVTRHVPPRTTVVGVPARKMESMREP